MILAEKYDYRERRIYPALNIDRIFTAFVRNYGGDFWFPGESHEMYELDCVIDGNLRVTSGSKVYDCCPYDLVIHEGNVFHTSRAVDGDIRILTISFTGDTVEYFVPSGKFSLTENEKEMISSLQSLLLPCSDVDFADADLSREDEQTIKCLLEILCLSLNKRRDEAKKASEDKDVQLFTDIVEYMKKNICSPLSVDDICSRFYVGRSKLKDLFRRFTGEGVIQHYNYLRTQKIINCLISDRSVANIAETMAFSSQNYLSSFFKRETGMTPSDYRRKILKT